MIGESGRTGPNVSLRDSLHASRVRSVRARPRNYHMGVFLFAEKFARAIFSLTIERSPKAR